jgi:hypothetical protein
MAAPDDVTGPTSAGTPPPDVTLDAPPPDGAPAVTGASVAEPGVTRLASTQVGEVHAQRVEATQSAIGRLAASDVRASQGAMGLVRGRSVELVEGAAGASAAERVEVRGGFAFLMVARHVSGDVRVLLDWRSAAAAVGALLVIGRLLRGRR